MSRAIIVNTSPAGREQDRSARGSQSQTSSPGPPNTLPRSSNDQRDQRADSPSAVPISALADPPGENDAPSSAPARPWSGVVRRHPAPLGTTNRTTSD